MNKGRYYIMTYYQILSCLKLWCFFFNQYAFRGNNVSCVHVKTHQVFFLIELIIYLQMYVYQTIMYSFIHIQRHRFGFTFKTAHTLQCTHSMDQNPYSIVVRSKKTAY